MSCCGNQRGPVLPSPLLVQKREAERPPAPAHAIRYEYVGATGMTVVGPITGRRYRFEGYGSRVPIDPRDAGSMRTVPHLRRV
jgi:hypothetical protein